MEEDRPKPKRELGQGRWDRRLIKRMVELSKADNYDEAKHEWKATGEIWWEGVGACPEWARGHQYKCLCGHNITYHFEILNTVTNVRECVGSDHIHAYLIFRAIKEETGLADEYITDEMIEDWITVRVEALKKKKWWSVHGENFTEMFNAVKELDLRVNVRKDGRYWDKEYRMWRDQTKIRKRGEGEFGKPYYKMASIVWRWNHPDNSSAQINKRGYPNQKLMNDLIMFHAFVDRAKAKVAEDEEELAKRMEHLKKFDEKMEKNKIAAMKRKQKVVQTIEDIQHEPAFVRACEFFGVEPFVPEQGASDWDVKFLTDIKYRMIKGQMLSDKQAAKLISILDSEKNEEPATEKQKNYLIRLGYEGDLDEITKNEASNQISRLKGEKNE
jgi:hypothetical protein